jgi:hypothetical protein
MAGSDLRIYYGDVRVVLRHDDPRTQTILGLVVKDALPTGEECVAVPATDDDFIALAARFFRARTNREAAATLRGKKS